MMGIGKEHFRDRDIFLDYDFEEVMFRYEYRTQRFFRKFYGKSEEVEVPHDSHLLNEAMRFGEEIEAKTYRVGKPQA